MANINSATVKAAVDALTDKVNGVIGTANTVLATASDSVSAAALAMGYRDTAAEHKAGAEAAAAQALQHSADVASAVVYQNLASVALSKNISMVDGCIDTSPRPSLAVQKATSWFDELGPMPARIEVIATTNDVFLFNGDDPSRPLWCQFESEWKGITSTSKALIAYSAYPLTAVRFTHGRLCVSANNNAHAHFIEADFGTDELYAWRSSGRYKWSGGISSRNSGSWVLENADLGLAGRYAYCMDARVYDWSPADPVSGLQIPTVMVGTDEGISFINGPAGVETVVDITHTDFDFVSEVRLGADGSISYVTDSSIAANKGRYIHMDFEIPAETVEKSRGYYGTHSDVCFGATTVLQPGQTDLILDGYLSKLADGLIGNSAGLTFHKINKQDPTRTLKAHVTADYNTGWMGKGCVASLLSSTDTSSLVGGNLVPNSDFATDISGWEPLFGALPENGGSISYNATDGTLDVSASGNVGFASWTGGIATVAGVTYTFVIDVHSFSGSKAVIWIDNSRKRLDLVQGVNVVEYTAADSNTTIYLGVPDGESARFNSVEMLESETDRSGSGNHATPHGVITRTPMGNSDMVGYGGDGHFEVDPSLVQFGLDDFCINAIVEIRGGNENQTILGNQGADPEVAALGNYTDTNFFSFVLDYHGGGNHKLLALMSLVDEQGAQVKNFTLSSDIPQNLKGGDIGSVAFLRRGNGYEFYLNGEQLGGTFFPTGAKVDAKSTHTVTIRNKYNPNDAHGIADLRVYKGYAPTPDEMREIARADLAKLKGPTTLTGTSSEVKAVARDEATGLHHGGTPSGRSDFAFPNRVNETATPVTTKIIAHDGTVMEQ